MKIPKSIRVFISILLFLLLSMMGFIRDTYLFRFGRERLPVFYDRTGEERYRMPESIDDLSQNLVQNPKWFSAAAYTLVFMVLSALTIWIIFRKRSLLAYTLWIHMGLILAAGILIASGLLIQSFRTFYLSAQYIKNLIQSPMLTLLLIAGFLIVEKKWPGSKTK